MYCMNAGIPPVVVVKNYNVSSAFTASRMARLALSGNTAEKVRKKSGRFFRALVLYFFMESAIGKQLRKT